MLVSAIEKKADNTKKTISATISDPVEMSSTKGRSRR